MDEIDHDGLGAAHLQVYPDPICEGVDREVDHLDRMVSHATLRDNHLYRLDRLPAEICATHRGCAKHRMNAYHHSAVDGPDHADCDSYHQCTADYKKTRVVDTDGKEKGEDRVEAGRSRLEDTREGGPDCIHKMRVEAQSLVLGDMMVGDRGDTAVVLRKEDLAVQEDIDREDTDRVDWKDPGDSHCDKIGPGVQEGERGGDHKAYEQDLEAHTV